jgi:tellurite resistance protein
VSVRRSAPSVATVPRPHTRVPLNTLAIPLGLAGLAQVWSVATIALGAPYGIAQGFWLVAALAWLWTAAAHVHRGTRTDQRLSQQLTHFAHGPLAALLPISAMLLGVGLHRTYAVAGTVLTLLAISAAGAFGAWMMTFWMNGEMALESVHGGYYLPISAAGLVGALAAGQTGLNWLAVGCFTVGLFFWLVISVFLFLRLALRPSMPAPLVPTLAIMVAPPAVAAAAWLTISTGRPDALFEGLTAMTVFMVLVQGPLLPRYRAIPFTHGFWSFTFPVASVAALAITWLRLDHPYAWRGMTIALVSLVTLLVAAIATKSLVLLRRSPRER